MKCDFIITVSQGFGVITCDEPGLWQLKAVKRDGLPVFLNRVMCSKHGKKWSTTRWLGEG